MSILKQHDIFSSFNQNKKSQCVLLWKLYHSDVGNDFNQCQAAYQLWEYDSEKTEILV